MPINFLSFMRIASIWSTATPLIAHILYYTISYLIIFISISLPLPLSQTFVRDTSSHLRKHAGTRWSREVESPFVTCTRMVAFLLPFSKLNYQHRRAVHGTRYRQPYIDFMREITPDTVLNDVQNLFY